MTYICDTESYVLIGIVQSGPDLLCLTELLVNASVCCKYDNYSPFIKLCPDHINMDYNVQHIFRK